MADTATWQAIQDRLEQNLKESEAGQWQEMSVEGDPNSPANPNIMALFTDMGYDKATIDALYQDPKTKKYNATGDLVPWCAAYVGSVLKQSNPNNPKGYLPQNLLANAYKKHSDKWGGKPQGKHNYDQWRENDVVVMKSPAGDGNHVGFLKAVDPKNDRFQLLGGNQNNTIMLGTYKKLDLIYNVYRGDWALPPEYDKPVIKDLSKEELRNPSTR